MRALIVDSPSGCLPTELRGVLDELGWRLDCADDYASALARLRESRVDALLLAGGPTDRLAGGPLDDAIAPDRRGLAELIALAEEHLVPAMLMMDGSRGEPEDSHAFTVTLPRDAQPSELKARLEVIERYQRVLRRVDREVTHMRRLARRLDRQFREMDQEMRLAGRLQRDFLPKLDQPIRNTRFATVYRPALWVSGDTFDVFRVTEDITAFYVADAVGHGMAASLLTMFIRRAIVAKQTSGRDFRVLTPSETLAGLNAALLDQGLPNNQFVTACYLLVDHRTLRVSFASGGHPYPLLLSEDGSIRELESTGALLGIMAEANFPTEQVQLRPGDKVLLYTDGLELAFGGAGRTSRHPREFVQEVRGLGGLTIQDMMKQLDGELDGITGSLDPSDDVTVVGLECTGG